MLGAERVLELQAPVVIPDLRGVLAACIAGAGVAVLPRYLVDNALERGALALLFEPKDTPKNALWLANAVGGLRAPRLALAYAMLKKAARGW